MAGPVPDRPGGQFGRRPSRRSRRRRARRADGVPAVAPAAGSASLRPGRCWPRRGAESPSGAGLGSGASAAGDRAGPAGRTVADVADGPFGRSGPGVLGPARWPGVVGGRDRVIATRVARLAQGPGRGGRSCSAEGMPGRCTRRVAPTSDDGSGRRERRPPRPGPARPPWPGSRPRRPPAAGPRRCSRPWPRPPRPRTPGGGPAQAVEHLDGLGPVGGGEEQDELVAAGPGQDVGRSAGPRSRPATPHRGAGRLPDARGRR